MTMCDYYFYQVNFKFKVFLFYCKIIFFCNVFHLFPVSNIFTFSCLAAHLPKFFEHKCCWLSWWLFAQTEWNCFGSKQLVASVAASV